MNQVYQTKDGKRVRDRHNSHLHIDVLPVLEKAIQKIDSKDRQFLKEQVTFPEFVGTTICVKTTEKDKILFAQRKGRLGKTRFVIDRDPEPCNSVVVILKKIEAKEDELGAEYVIITAFVGDTSEPEPWDKFATSKSAVFWAEHALVFGHDEIVVDTVQFEF